MSRSAGPRSGTTVTGSQTGWLVMAALSSDARCRRERTRIGCTAWAAAGSPTWTYRRAGARSRGNCSFPTPSWRARWSLPGRLRRHRRGWWNFVGASTVHTSDISVAVSLQDADGHYAAALTANPWLDTLPVILRDITAVQVDDDWVIRDADGAAMPLPPRSDRGWHLRAGLTAPTGAPLWILEWRGPGAGEYGRGRALAGVGCRTGIALMDWDELVARGHHRRGADRRRYDDRGN